MSLLFSGLSVHLGAAERQQRADEARHSVDQERHHESQPRARQPGAPLHRQHRQPRDGGGVRQRHPQAARLWVSA